MPLPGHSVPARSVRDSIEVLLRTRPGEQLMRRTFGGGLEDFVFQSNTLVTRRRIRDAIRDTLQAHEPRIALDRVEVDEVEGQPAQVAVEIAYRLVRTGEPKQLALTMELEG